MGARGEVTLQTGEREVRILFTNRAIAQAEDSLGKGIIEILQGFEQGGSVSEIARLLQAGMEAHRRDARLGGRAISIAEAFSVMDEAGFAPTTEAIAVGVSEVLSYGTELEEEDTDPNE